MTIRLYFDPETHHHVMTVYTESRAATIAQYCIQNAHQQGLHFSLVEERFSDFQTDNGITLPAIRSSV